MLESLSSSPQFIVAAFDQCLDYAFGRSLGRDNPHASDISTAQRWIDEGADLVLCIMVFTQQMAWMHEKYLRSGHLRDRSFIPHSLKVFDENIAAAVRVIKAGGVDETEAVYSQWCARVHGWKRNPKTWRTEHWGPAPGEAGCRVPASLLFQGAGIRAFCV
jgi:hypothetical protein